MLYERIELIMGLKAAADARNEDATREALCNLRPHYDKPEKDIKKVLDSMNPEVVEWIKETILS